MFGLTLCIQDVGARKECDARCVFRHRHSLFYKTVLCAGGLVDNLVGFGLVDSHHSNTHVSPIRHLSSCNTHISPVRHLLAVVRDLRS